MSKSAYELAECYHSVITSILDKLSPVAEMTVRIRSDRSFYDGECRQVRRMAHRLVRA